VKVREVIRLIRADGWHNVKAKGGHRQYKHPVKRGRVTIPGRPNDDLAPKTLESILKQVGLSEDRGS
jgi:predicted RNA binding protein YcfA (HicA-like mRNA interferase family)